jgi:predicted N-acyltransferase
VSQLPARARNVVRRERRRLADAGVTFSVEEMDPSLRRTVGRLEANLNHKYGGVFDDAAVRRLHDAVASCLGDRARYGISRLSDAACGSVLTMRWRDELHARTVGFDYELQGRLPVYFGLLFYGLIEYASETGVRRLHYSTGADRTKRSRGCRLVQQYAYLHCLDPRRHAELANLLGSAPPATEPPADGG